MLKTVVAIEQDGLDFRALTLTFDVPDENFDLECAVRKAATEYCQTEEGKNIYEFNCSSFNWADFGAFVPDAICEKHGFKKHTDALSDIIVDWDSHLVNDSELED